MGGYAGDSYDPGTDRERAIGFVICAAVVVAFLVFLGYCVWSKL